MGGLRKLVCLMPVETSDHEGWTVEAEQPGTSYNSNNSNISNISNISNNSNNSNSNEGPNFGYRESHKRAKAKRVNCSSGGAQFFACFRAGAINLIVHPACELACQRQGASTVQPVNSLPRSAFLDRRAEDHEHGDDPTSPVVSCIGQVRMEKPCKTPPRTTTQQRRLKSNSGGKPEEEESTVTSRHCKWKQVLGARGIVNPSQQTNTTKTTTTTRTTTAMMSTDESSVEFHIDLNRFGSAAAQATPTFGNQMKFGRPDEFAAARDSSSLMRKAAAGVSKDTDDAFLKCSIATGEEVTGVPLWQRRSGTCKPVSLVVKRRVLRSVT